MFANNRNHISLNSSKNQHTTLQGVWH